jgi:AraC family transcriptional regulator
MIQKQFPDLQWLKKQADSGFENRKDWGGRTLPHQGWPTVILNTRTSSTYRDNIRGPLSIFTNISGASAVACNNKKTIVQEGFFYVTNHDQHYTLEITQKSPVETFNIHFGEYFADQVFRTLAVSTEKLLDESLFSAPFTRIELFNRLHVRDATFNGILEALRKCEDNKLLEEEKLYELLIHLLKEESQLKKLQRQLPVLKNSTRQELIKRLLIAADYIYAFYYRDITLDELAAAACLSKFHFLRLFKIAFNKTPHHFLNEIKVERSKLLLKDHSL